MIPNMKFDFVRIMVDPFARKITPQNSLNK